MNRDPQSIKIRREKAIKRTETRTKISPEQQLEKLDAEGWVATKERARLHKLIAKSSHKKEKKS